jgi:transposase-like protein/DNA-directed RNA polymerase subunit M/transcription elongation factor TFIIS
MESGLSHSEEKGLLIMTPSVFDNRSERGLAIAKADGITENANGSFSVPSQTLDAVSYTVMNFGGVWVCDCPDYQNRADSIEACKHIYGVKFWIAAKVELQSKPKPKVFADDANQCPKCGSIRVIHFGSTYGKKSFKCKDCEHRFRESALVKGSRYSPEMVSLTLDLYFSGMSLRKIARTVNNHFGTMMGKSSIYRWIETFVPRISEYVDSLTPELSETWHADELFVKMKGGVNYKAHYGGEAKNIAFLWNVMDRKTRFLLASKLSTFRDVAGADRAFREAMSNAKGSQPERVFTDGLGSYKTLMASLPESQRPEHIANAGVRKTHANNNRIERLNGTLRERVKVQRGWKSMKTPIAEGQRIHYNFVKPHQALAGQTPAEMAGLVVEGENKWLSLMKAAFSTKGGTAS